MVAVVGDPDPSSCRAGPGSAGLAGPGDTAALAASSLAAAGSPWVAGGEGAVRTPPAAVAARTRWPTQGLAEGLVARAEAAAGTRPDSQHWSFHQSLEIYRLGPPLPCPNATGPAASPAPRQGFP
jgi:hypothetical protein